MKKGDRILFGFGARMEEGTITRERDQDGLDTYGSYRVMQDDGREYLVWENKIVLNVSHMERTIAIMTDI